MYPSFCLFQNILTKEIIGHGTKREGLYYMDDFNISRVNTIIQTSDKEQQVWSWHHRLGHPSFRYLKHLFPSLFSNFHESDLRCETCIQAKSHCVPYLISFKKCETPFTLVHSDVLDLLLFQFLPLLNGL